MVADALDLATPTLREVARWTGASYHAVRMYRARERGAPPAVRRRLARGLRAHARKLVAMAARLEADAERHP
jgi:hypothetical protein